MPRTAYDYTQARNRYVKGHNIKEIAADLDLPYEGLVKHAQRQGWTKLRTEVVQHSSDAVLADIKGKLGAYVGKIDQVIHAGLDNVLAKGLETLGLRDLALALDCAEKAHRIGRQHYQLDDDKRDAKPASLTVNVAISQADNNARYTGKVIDVESVACDASAPAAQMLGDSSVADASTQADVPTADATQAPRRRRKA